MLIILFILINVTFKLINKNTCYYSHALLLIINTIFGFEIKEEREIYDEFNK
jgi:hypothetical protein